MQPPGGSGEHPYVVTVYAMDVPEFSIRQKTSLADFERTLQGRVVDKAELTGTFIVT